MMMVLMLIATKMVMVMMLMMMMMRVFEDALHVAMAAHAFPYFPRQRLLSSGRASAPQEPGAAHTPMPHGFAAASPSPGDTASHWRP